MHREAFDKQFDVPWRIAPLESLVLVRLSELSLERQPDRRPALHMGGKSLRAAGCHRSTNLSLHLRGRSGSCPCACSAAWEVQENCRLV